MGVDVTPPPNKTPRSIFGSLVEIPRGGGYFLGGSIFGGFDEFFQIFPKKGVFSKFFGAPHRTKQIFISSPRGGGGLGLGPADPPTQAGPTRRPSSKPPPLGVEARFSKKKPGPGGDDGREGGL